MYAYLNMPDYTGSMSNYAGPYSNSYNPSQMNNTQPMQDTSGAGMGWGNITGSLISGSANYFQQAAQQKQAAEMAKLSAQAQKELLEQQRGFQMEGRKYRQEAASKWKKYFGGNS